MTTTTPPQASAEPTNPERQGVQVIARAAGLLRALERRPEGLSLGELARAIALPRSTVQRIVDALDAEGLVIAASAASGVRLGPALLRLAAATHFHLADAARHTLEALAEECGETVDLSLLDQDKVVFIDQVAGTQRLTALSAVGLSFPLHASANGKALLAALTPTELARIRPRLRLAACTPNTLTSWTALERELADARSLGVAFDREENALGISAVSTVISSASGERAAVSIPVPTQRFVAQEAALTAALLRHTRRLQQSLTR